MQPFTWQLGTRLICGSGAIDKLGELARELDAKQVMIVSDAGVAAAGHTSRAVDGLRGQSIAVHVFADVHCNPSTRDVECGAKEAREFQPDLLVGLGGGSAMDCAKGINFLHTNGGVMEDYWGFGKAAAPLLPMIAVPTTAGTGSEVQCYALISKADSHQKMACGDYRARPRVAILDPQLLLTTPRSVATMAAVDAVSHAVESYVTTGRNAVSTMLGRESFRHLSTAIERVIAGDETVEVWAAMQWGACLAGLAIDNSMLGAAHALANPLTAHCDIPHGQAVAVCLPHVVRFNSQVCGTQYGELRSCLPADRRVQDNADLSDWLTNLLPQLGLQTALASLRVPADRLPPFADEAAAQWTARHNPRPLSASDALALYRAAW